MCMDKSKLRICAACALSFVLPASARLTPSKDVKALRCCISFSTFNACRGHIIMSVLSAAAERDSRHGGLMHYDG